METHSTFQSTHYGFDNVVRLASICCDKEKKHVVYFKTNQFY